MKIPLAEKIIEKISEINHIYPEEITIHRLTKTPCTCLDPILKESTIINHELCGGDGYIEIDDSITIPVSLSTDGEQKEFMPIGTYFSDDLMITIDKVELEQYNIDVKKIDYFTYKGQDYILDKFKYGSLNGLIYEVKCLLKKKK